MFYDFNGIFRGSEDIEAPGLRYCMETAFSSYKVGNIQLQ
jgi:hypothetical protein